MKNEFNHIDEFFQKGLESADVQPPSELWNQISQSWDQTLQAATQTSFSTGAVASKWSGLTKFFVGLTSTVVVGGGVYLVSELTSPDNKKISSGIVAEEEKIHTPNSKSVIDQQSQNKSEQNVPFSEGIASDQQAVERLNATMRDTQFSIGVIHSDKQSHNEFDAQAKGMQHKASATQKETTSNDGVKHNEKLNLNGLSQLMNQLEGLIQVEQLENRVIVTVQGANLTNAVLKSVSLGKEKMQGMPSNSNFLNGEFMGWEVPVAGEKLVFERKCFLELRKLIKVQLVFKLLSADKQRVEREFTIEKEIEIQPWISLTAKAESASTWVAVGSEVIPNVFTPNGDGLNDEYYLKIHEPKSFQMIISSAERTDLGTVFQTNSTAGAWNGKKGELVCPEGKYWVSIRRVYERIDNQGKWIESTKVERILMELKRD